MIKMKNSGVEWIGDIPVDWETTAIKNYCINVFAGGTPQSNNSEYWDGDIPWIPSGSCHDCKISSAPKFITKEGFENSSTKLIPANTALVAMTGATCGNTGYLTFDSCANQSVTAYVAKSSTYSLFIWYLLQAVKEHLLTFQTGGAQGGVNVNNCKNIVVPYISFDKQKKIADYLDEKCAKIDEIIEKQQTVIEKLKEYKLSVITETITKGLDKTVDMKVLDGEWVDSIPAHWKWMSLKSVTEFITCGVAATPEYTDKESGALFLSAQNVKQGVMDYSIERYITKELHESLTKKRKPKRGDLLQVRVGASIGNVAVVDTDEEFSVYVSLTHLRCNETVKNEFLKFCMMSPLWLQKAFSYVDFAGSQGNLNVADLRILKVPVPPINEQIDIMNYLKTKTNMIDYNIHQKEEILNRLQEYKKSLIYEVVTGKKEV